MPDIAQERRARSILKRRLANGRGGDYLSRVKCEGGERVPQDGRPRINIIRALIGRSPQALSKRPAENPEYGWMNTSNLPS